MVNVATALPLLEVREAEGAFERLDTFLRDAGFFVDGGRAAQHRRADVYLGFGLSDSLRRTSRAARPEPIDLPLLACRIRDAAELDADDVELDASEAALTSGGYRLGP